MSHGNNLRCCGRSMLRVTGEYPYWTCTACGTRRNREGTIITPGGTSGTEWSVDSRSDGQDGPQSDERIAETGDASPSNSHIDGKGVGDLNGNPTGPAPVTDHQPRCWKCGRVLGRYFSRPWSIRCRRCKATNQGALKGA